MPTVVDELVLELGLGGQDKFKQGLTEALAQIARTKAGADTAAKDMEASGARAAEFFSRIKTEALSLIGVLGGTAGLGAVIKESATSMADLNRAATNLGVSTRDLGALQNVMERNGASAQSVTATLEHLQTTMQHIRTFGGGQDFFGYLAPIGGNINDSPFQIFMKAMRFIQEHPGQTAQQNQILQHLGFNDDTIRAMRQMATVPELMRELQGEMARVDTEKMTLGAVRLQKAWEDFAHQTKFIGDRITNNLAGPLSHVLDVMTDLEKQHPQLVIGVTFAAEAIAALKALAVTARFLGMTAMAAAIDAAIGASVAAGAGAGAVIALTGPGGGEDADFSKRMNDKWIAEHPAGSSWLPGWWPSWLGGRSSSALPPDIENEVRRQALLRGLDADHMVRLAQQEGGGYHNVSPAGAFGPMQLMPGTAARYGVTQTSPWQANVAAGMDYYHSLLQQFGGNYALADAAYNAGPNNPGVRHWAATGDPSQLPGETRNYVGSINRAPNGVPRVGPLFDMPHPPVPVPAGSGGGDTNLHVSNLHVTLPNVRDAHQFGAELPGALTAQANRGLIQ